MIYALFCDDNCYAKIPFKRWACVLLLFVISVFTANAQEKKNTINVAGVNLATPVTLTQMGGTNPSGEKIAVNNSYLTKDGIPIIPITGEMHYSRYPNQFWDESIKKMKAGGINMIATYVFWNIHEEKEGKFNWSGDRDLRKFVELCAKNKIFVVVRVGPFDHGEIRNGGLPDWLLGKPVVIRSNDSAYLHYVDILYTQIGKQLRGLYYKDGGPIVAVQLENEMQHSASPWGLTYPGQPYDLTVADRDINSAHEGVSVSKGNNPYAEAGNDHMRALKALAIKAGIIPPLFTATGWGYAAGIPNETLPVTAAYAYPTWTAKRELSPFYLYKDMHRDPDYAPVRYKPMDYPAFAAELGSGIMTTYSRRPIVPAESLDALINRCIGSGANGIGYYMYHGGSTPVADHYFFNDEAYGYPKISYDFQAPIGEYGQVRPSFHRLKLLHFFINDFAKELAPMVTALPEDNAGIKPENSKDLRYAVRTDGNSGFLFLNNFQDNDTTTDKRNIRIGVTTKTGTVHIPEKGGITLQSGENLILPFNFDLDDSKLIYSTAQLLAKGNYSGNDYYVFFNTGQINPEFCFEKSCNSVKAITNCKVQQRAGKIWVNSTDGQTAGFSITNKAGHVTRVLVVSKTMALKSYLRETGEGRQLVFSDALVLNNDKNTEILSDGNSNYSISIYPKLTSAPKIDRGTISEITGSPVMSNFKIDVPQVVIKPAFNTSGTRKMTVTIPQSVPDGLNDIFLNVDYVGDTAMGFLNGDLVTDEFYKGTVWQIGLKRFTGIGDGNMGFYFRPMMSDATYMVDLPPAIAKAAGQTKQTLTINSPTYIPQYKSVISFK